MTGVVVRTVLLLGIIASAFLFALHLEIGQCLSQGDHWEGVVCKQSAKLSGVPQTSAATQSAAAAN